MQRPFFDTSNKIVIFLQKIYHPLFENAMMSDSSLVTVAVVVVFSMPFEYLKFGNRDII